MAYTASTLSLVTEGPLTGGGQVWRHASADAQAVVRVGLTGSNGFIANGGLYGMKINDILWHTDTSTGIVTSHRVVSVNATTGSVDLTDGSVVASGTNTD